MTDLFKFREGIFDGCVMSEFIFTSLEAINPAEVPIYVETEEDWWNYPSHSASFR